MPPISEQHLAVVCHQHFALPNVHCPMPQVMALEPTQTSVVLMQMSVTPFSTGQHLAVAACHMPQAKKMNALAKILFYKTINLQLLHDSCHCHRTYP